MRLPQWLSHKESACSSGDTGVVGLLLGWEDPLEKVMAWQPIAVFLPVESLGQRGLVGYSPWGLKELDMTEAT